jgi:hypothetical protein
MNISEDQVVFEQGLIVFSVMIGPEMGAPPLQPKLMN